LKGKRKREGKHVGEKGEKRGRALSIEKRGRLSFPGNKKKKKKKRVVDSTAATRPKRNCRPVRVLKKGWCVLFRKKERKKEGPGALAERKVAQLTKEDHAVVQRGREKGLRASCTVCEGNRKKKRKNKVGTSSTSPKEREKIRSVASLEGGETEKSRVLKWRLFSGIGEGKRKKKGGDKDRDCLKKKNRPGPTPWRF